MKILQRLLLAGLISGLFLGLLLKAFQAMTGKTVYTLLLNVDYFPLIGDWQMPEIVEFALHMVVSMIIVMVLYFILRRFDFEKKLVMYIVLNGLTGVLIYPTTALSERTPALTDGTALFLWLLGHLAYGCTVWLCIRLLVKGESG